MESNRQVLLTCNKRMLWRSSYNLHNCHGLMSYGGPLMQKECNYWFSSTLPTRSNLFRVAWATWESYCKVCAENKNSEPSEPVVSKFAQDNFRIKKQMRGSQFLPPSSWLGDSSVTLLLAFNERNANRQDLKLSNVYWVCRDPSCPSDIQLFPFSKMKCWSMTPS